MILSDGAVSSLMPVGSLADTTPMFSDRSYYPHVALELTGKWAAYGEMYKTQVWVSTIVRKLAFATARLPLEVWLQGAGTANNPSPLPGGLANLLARPNDELDAFRLWLWTSSTFDVYGEAFWLKVRDARGRVARLHPIHPSNLIIRRDPDTHALTYLYSVGASNTLGLLPIPYDDIVPFLGYNPDDLVRGMSPLEPLRQTLLNEDAARRATAAWWRNGARPSIALRHPGSLSEGAQNRLRAQFESRHAGADSMGGTAILEEGMEAQVLQLSAEEMQYIQTRKLNREEICAQFDIPPPVVHILDRATFSNITEQMRSMYRDTMAPRFAMFESAINHHLVPDFDATGKAFVAFNMDDVLRGDFETRAVAIGSLIERGVVSPNEARPMFGQAPSPNPIADKLFAMATLVPLGTPAERVSITASEAATPAQSQELQQISGQAQAVAAAVEPAKALTVRAVKSRVSRKAVGPDQRAALVSEHVGPITAFLSKQAGAVATNGAANFDPADWQAELADLLSTLGQATAQVVGDKIAKDLGGAYTLDELSTWLADNSAGAAAAINQSTANQIQSAVDDAIAAGEDPQAAASDMMTGSLSGRADQLSVTRVAIVAGFAAVDSGRQHSAATKTWIVNSSRPRPSHAEMSGETVPLNEQFSNGMNWPGDPAGGVDEVAGCTCAVGINSEGNSQ